MDSSVNSLLASFAYLSQYYLRMHNSILLVVLFIATSFGLAACETFENTKRANFKGNVAESYSADAPEPQKSPLDSREYATTILDNGLRVLAVSDADAAEGAISVTVNAGSFQNPPEFPGLAHYLEHMLFLGTQRYPEPDALISFVDENAGRWNAYTSSDHTNYFFSIDAKQMDKALDYFSDYFRAPLLDPEYSDKERNAVNSEWSIGREQDGYMLNRLLYLTANPAHPGVALTVGNLETLPNDKEGILDSALKEFFARYYDPALMTLAIVGPQTPDELIRMVRDNFADIPSTKVQPPAPLPKGLPEDQLGVAIYYEPKQAGRQLFIDFAIPNRKDAYFDKSYGYIANLIGSEEPGAPARVLRDQGLINSLSSGPYEDAYGPDGIFRITVDLTKKGANETDLILQSVFAYIDLIQLKGINEDYYEEYRSLLEKRFQTQEQSDPLGTAYSLTPKMRYLPAQDILAAPYLYTAFDSQFIRKTLEGFSPKRSRIWYVMPHDKKTSAIPYYAGSYAVKRLEARELEKFDSPPANIVLKLPPKNDLFSSTTARTVAKNYAKPTLVRDSAHQKIWLTHASEHRNEKGFYHAQFNSDLGESSLQNKLSFMLLSKILGEELLSLSDKAYRAGLELRVVNDPGSMLAFDIQGDTTKHLELAKQTMAIYKSLNLDQIKLDRAREALLDDLKNLAQKRPFRQAYAVYNTVIQQPAFETEALITALPGMSLSALQSFDRNYRAQHKLHVFAFGNYTKEDALAIADEFALMSAKQDGLIKNGYIEVRPQLNLKHARAIEQTDNVLLQAYLSSKGSLKERALASLISGFARIAFFTELRSNEQLGYAVSISPTRIGEHGGLIMLVQSDHKNLEFLSNRFERFRREYAEDFANITVDKFNDLKSSQLNQLREPAANFSEEASRYLDDFVKLKFTFDSREKYIQALESTSLEEMLAAYKALLLNDRTPKIQIELQGTRRAEAL